MLTRNNLLLIALIVVMGALFATAEVKANPSGVPVSDPGPFSCTTSSFKVEAILVGGAFPAIVPCPTNPGQNCSDYGYKVSALSPTGPNVDHTVFAIAATQDLSSTNPSGSFVSPAGAGDNTTNFLINAKHEYAIRFNSANTKSVEAHIYIVGSSSPRVSSVLVRSGTKLTESCLIAGAGVAGDPFQPVFQEQLAVVAGGKCNAHLIFDSTGNLIDVTTDPPCVSARPEVVFVNGQALQNNTSASGITFGENTTTCYGPPKPRTPACICTAEPCP